MSDQTDEVARFETGGDLKEKLDDYNKKYLLSDAEQDVIKCAIKWYHEAMIPSIEELKNLAQSVKNYEEIKNKLR